MLHVVVGVIVKAEKLDAFLCLLREHASGSRAEPGCLRFEVLREIGAPCRFRILETWVDRGALEAHRETLHYLRWKVEMPGIQAESRTHEEYEESPCVTSEIEIASRLGWAARGQGRRIAFTNGCFDILHAGHVALLRAARGLADILVVGLNSDSSVRALKGPGRPVNSLGERREVLEALGCINLVLTFDSRTPLALLHALRPDVLVKGGDYSKGEVVGGDFVESYGGRIHLVPLREGCSTTKILRRVTS